MTDKDRYGVSLGKGFAERVRPVLCSDDEEFEIEAPEVTARYIVKQLKKDVEDLRAVLGEIRRSAKDQRGFFDGQEARKEFERRLTGSLGGEHLLECLERGFARGSKFSDIAYDLASKAVAATRDRLSLQLNYKNDTKCHTGFDRHRAAILVETHRMLLREAGIGKAKARNITKRGTTELLTFVVARDK